MDLSPLAFTPKLSPKIWGGRRLERFGKVLPAGQAIGESWDLYDRPGDSALVADGPFKGQTLNALMKEWGPRLLGQKLFEAQPAYFPLMVKLIDANDALSVQVHPDDDQAARMVGPDELGKTEMWYVLDAEPGATVVASLKKGTDRAGFLAALKQGKLEGVLNEFAVSPGDMIFLPAGRVHAIGKGCLMAEVQQNSDTTYRVFDYNRLENGKPRALHLDQALECIRFGEELPDKAGDAVRCGFFTVERLKIEGSFRPKLDGSRFHILQGLKGRARVNGAVLEPGGCLLLPAALDWGVEGSAELLWSRP